MLIYTVLQEENDKRKYAEDEVRMLNASLEQRVADQTRELSALYEVSAVASRHLNLENIFNYSGTRHGRGQRFLLTILIPVSLGIKKWKERETN